MGSWHEAEVYLRQADSIIAGIIEHTGLCELIKHEGGFAELAISIIGQQPQIKLQINSAKVPEAL